MKFDVIIPCYHIDEKFFYDNLKAWIREIPINNLYIGVHNPKLYELFEGRIEFMLPKVHLIDMTKYKTLGTVIVELMKLTTTEWVVYFHSDARPTRYSFKQMRAMINGKVGIIESEHLHVNGKGERNYYNYYDEPRSYSGFQLIYRSSIESAIQQIEDDYVYRNEDLIFQNVCEFNGYEYKKNYALHFHYTTRTGQEDWTFNEQETRDMQWKGLIKYSPLKNKFMEDLIRGSVGYNIRNFDLTIKEVIKFTEINNQIWLKIIKRKFGVEENEM